MTTETALREAIEDVIVERFDAYGFSTRHVVIGELTDRLIDLLKDVLDLVPAQVKPDAHRREAFEDPNFRQGTLDSGAPD